MLLDEHDREAAVVTFLTSGSGLALMGIGSSFWALLAGLIALLVLKN